MLQCVSRVGLNSQQVYWEWIFRAFALSVAFHLAVLGGSELSRHLPWLKHTPWSQRLKSAEQKRGAFPRAGQKKPSSASPREVSITFVQINPNRAVPPSKPPDPVQTKNAEPVRVEKSAESRQAPPVAIPTTLPPPVAPPPPTTVQTQPIAPPQPAIKTPPNTQNEKPSDASDVSPAGPVPTKPTATPLLGANTAPASNPASPEKQSPKAASLDSAGLGRRRPTPRRPTPQRRRSADRALR